MLGETRGRAAHLPAGDLLLVPSFGRLARRPLGLERDHERRLLLPTKKKGTRKKGRDIGSTTSCSTAVAEGAKYDGGRAWIPGATGPCCRPDQSDCPGAGRYGREEDANGLHRSGWVYLLELQRIDVALLKPGPV